MKVQPVTYTWREVDAVDAEGIATKCMAMVPLRKYGNVAKRQFSDGETYTLGPIEERSMASHNAFFAALHEYYENLPEKIADRWPSAEHFRKWCLVETGWCEEKEFELQSEKHAKALAAFIRTEDAYARLAVRGLKVIVWRPRSQSLQAMGKADFQKSKNDVLELAAQFVGVKPSQMMREAGKVA